MAAVPASGRKRRRSGLHGPVFERAEAQLISETTPLGRIEAALRSRGRLDAEELAELADVAPADLPALVNRHPMVFVDECGRYGLVRKIPAEYADPEIAESKLSKSARSEGEPVRCPSCGASHLVSPGVRNRIDRGLRTARCASCQHRGPAITLDRGRLSHRDFERFAPEWLARFTDEEIARMATSMFGQGSAEAVSRWRQLLLAGVGAV